MFPEKYSGDPTAIIMRSSWETRFALWCDRNPSVIKWKSEETIVPYRCPTDDRLHRYFVDFQIQVRQKDGLFKTFLIEVKSNQKIQQCTDELRALDSNFQISFLDHKSY